MFAPGLHAETKALRHQIPSWLREGVRGESVNNDQGEKRGLALSDGKCFRDECPNCNPRLMYLSQSINTAIKAEY